MLSNAQTASAHPLNPAPDRGLLSFFNRIFRSYADWLVEISWQRLTAISFVFLLFCSLIQSLVLGEDAAEPFFSIEIKSTTATESAEKPSEPQSRDSAKSSKHIRIGQTQNHPMNAIERASWLWILLSIVIKIAHGGRVRAEFIASSALETAEKAAIEQQLTEARLSTLQAQLEPHFLFNTLSSIDYLILTDPPKAGEVLRSFIAFLRGSLPDIQQSRACPLRPLGIELDFVEAYLQIQKARMEERLHHSINVPQGLRSALFPPFMLQTLAENAIKHGLEPKREGGSLQISASIEDGQLQITVHDSGIGLEAYAESSLGTGLTNLRERLRLLFGEAAQFNLRSDLEGGTTATLRLPYSTASRKTAPEGALESKHP